MLILAMVLDRTALFKAERYELKRLSNIGTNSISSSGLHSELSDLGDDGAACGAGGRNGSLRAWGRCGADFESWRRIGVL